MAARKRTETPKVDQPPDQSLLDRLLAGQPGDPKDYELVITTLVPAGSYGPGDPLAVPGYPRAISQAEIDRTLELICGIAPSPEAQEAYLFEMLHVTERDRAVIPEKYRPRTRDGWIAFWARRARREREGVTGRPVEAPADPLPAAEKPGASTVTAADRADAESAYAKQLERLKQAMQRAEMRLEPVQRRIHDTLRELLEEGYRGRGRNARVGEMVRRVELATGVKVTRSQYRTYHDAYPRLLKEELHRDEEAPPGAARQEDVNA